MHVWSMQRNRGKNRMGKTRDLFKKIRDTKGIFHAKMIQWMLAIWSLAPLSFLNPACISGSVHVLLKPSMKDFEHFFASMWDECNCAVVWTFFGVAFFWGGGGIGMKTDLFQSCGHCWVFQICCHIECSTFTASSFRIWVSSAEL